MKKKRKSKAQPEGVRQAKYYQKNKDEILANQQLERFLKTLEKNIERFREKEPMYDKLLERIKSLNERCI
jgi:hypothetical protein